MKQITDKDFIKETSKGLVLVDFWAPWCGPCRQIAPILEDLQKEMGDKVSIVKMNVDENPETTTSLEIKSIPTLIVFKDGKLVDRTVGAAPKGHYQKILEKHL